MINMISSNKVVCNSSLLIVFIASVFFAQTECCLAFEENITSKELLNSVLINSLSHEISQHEQELNYCPDNTCFSFRTNKIEKETELYDFTYIFLYYVSGYVYLEDIRQNVLCKHIDKITSKYSAYCNIAGEVNKVKCILMRLASDNSIDVYFIRYDEGAKNEVKVILDESLDQRLKINEVFSK